MLLRTSITNRRKFLERTALGAGSVLFLPGLLNSCTDHRIPDPGTPVVGSPEVGAGDGPTFDVNDDLKIVVTNGLNKVPIVGEILSTLLAILWPASKQDVWSQVKEQVEEVVGQKISDFNYRYVQEDVRGLRRGIVIYTNTLRTGTPNEKNTAWSTIRLAFAVSQDHFQPEDSDQAVLMLPLFAQFANLYLSVLRDGLIGGKSWNMTDADIEQLRTDLKSNIDDFVKYVQDTAENYYVKLKGSAQQNPRLCDPFRTLNTYERKMTLTALDFAVNWPNYDIAEFPNGAYTELTRQIYSDVASGCFDVSTPVELSTMHPTIAVPTQLPTQIIVRGDQTIISTMVTYPAGGGPDSVTQDWQGSHCLLGTTDSPYGGTVTIPTTNPIVNVIYNLDSLTGDSNLTVVTVKFIFAEGPPSPMFGGRDADFLGCNCQKTDWPNPVTVGYGNHALSLIHVAKAANGGPNEDCASGNIPIMEGLTFGFKYRENPTSTLRALRFLYVRSPQEQSVAEFVSAHSTQAVATNLLGEEAELKAARQAYWAYMEALAAELK